MHIYVHVHVLFHVHVMYMDMYMYRGIVISNDRFCVFLESTPNFKRLQQSHFNKITAFLGNQGGCWCVLQESEEFEWLRLIIAEEFAFKNYMWNHKIFIYFDGFVHFMNCITAPEFERVRCSCIWHNYVLCHTEQLCHWHTVLIRSMWCHRRSKPWKTLNLAILTVICSVKKYEFFLRFLLNNSSLTQK